MNWDYIIILFLVYLFQMGIAALVNMFNLTRVPTSFYDFIKLTFLLYVILNIKKIKGY